MKDIQTFRNALKRLCDGNYTRTDIEYVATVLIRETRRFLFHREKKNYQFRGEWENGSAEMRDIALDFIAHLFARDEQNIFIELQHYFASCWELADQQFEEVVYQLLNSVIQQQSIRLFKERDSFGKTFYRSLRYLQNKHSNWKRTFVDGRLVIHHLNNAPVPIPRKELREIVRGSVQNSATLTEQVAHILETAITAYEQAVPVDELLAELRQLTENILDYESPRDTMPVDPFIYEVISKHVKVTLREVDGTILQKYERDGKLTPAEREGFREGVQQILIDFADGGCRSNYYEYLSQSLQSIENVKMYKSQYRTQFEYVAKKAKSIFSANVENALSM